jgi:thiamine pyrophosphokinase
VEDGLVKFRIGTSFQKAVQLNQEQEVWVLASWSGTGTLFDMVLGNIDTL